MRRRAVSPDRRRVRHLETRREILDHAWDIARREGLAGLSLSELARHMQMRTPSLYTYFESKNAVYDAMFAEAAAAFLERLRNLDFPSDHLRALQMLARAFFDFCVEDPARYQLLFQRTIPGFEPSVESYAVAVEALALTGEFLAEFGIRDQAHLDMVTAIATGLTDQQISNEPGGHRWRDLLDETIEMLYRHVTSVEAKGH
jgi:AcrR family transcriptional regulator